MIIIIKILSIVFIFLLVIYILLKISDKKVIKTSTTKSPIKYCGDSLDINTLKSYLKIIQKGDKNEILKVKDQLSIVCKGISLIDINNSGNLNILVTFLLDLLSYKEGYIDLNYIKQWCELCNNLGVIKIKNDF